MSLNREHNRKKATEKFTAHHAELAAMLETLTALVAEDSARADMGEPINYTDVGSVSRVKSDVADILEYLTA